MPDEPYTVTARRDRTSLVYYRQHDGSWKAPMFTRRLSLDELEQDFGPTVPVDVDNVEALLADHARLKQATGDIPELHWHYGPTKDDPNPGSMWHYGCGGEVWYMDSTPICTKCGQQGPEGQA